MSHELNTFEKMCEAVGSDATPAQVDRLTSWVLENIGSAYWGAVEQIAAENGISALITEFSMRRGEMGQ